MYTPNLEEMITSTMLKVGVKIIEAKRPLDSAEIVRTAVEHVYNRLNLPVVRSTGSAYMKAIQMPDELKRFGGPGDEEDEEEPVAEETE